MRGRKARKRVIVRNYTYEVNCEDVIYRLVKLHLEDKNWGVRFLE